jgi:glycosyltransferase involved in cell wall biosynthesis
LEQVALIAKYAKNARFVVIGKTNEYSFGTLQNIKDYITALGVEDRVTLLKDLPFEELLVVLSKAKVYLHVMPCDHFGISVVEAMASGCVPVVHRSGGPWTDILEGKQGAYGFSYLTAIEAANQIEDLILDENLRSAIAAKASHRAQKFDKSVFMIRMAEVVEKIAA